MRGSSDDDEAADVADTLVALMHRSPRLSNLDLWRGVRSVMNTFGRPVTTLPFLIAQERFEAGFLATSLDRRIAEEQFVVPQGPGGAALLHLTIRGEVPGLWLPLLGEEAPEMRRQEECLLGPGVRMSILEARNVHRQPIVEVEVWT